MLGENYSVSAWLNVEFHFFYYRIFALFGSSNLKAPKQPERRNFYSA
jgi:hypothetical protein